MSSHRVLAFLLLLSGTGCSAASPLTLDAGEVTPADSGGVGKDSGAATLDGGSDANLADCGEPASPPNEAGCPATYSMSYLGEQCAPVGLVCAYPGAGDGISPGCNATAMLWCVAAGEASVDAGGIGTWIVAQ
jgi:hypothetical protein